ncbi:hypothetical protein BURK1_03340 [Burkholderiales bacterium]|nr:hypothetical protein BURK1_03340 [Burkholderiales bacterium]
MAGTKRRTRAASAPSAWEQFASMSRNAVKAAGRRPAKSVRRRPAKGARKRAAVRGTQSLDQAIAQALKLGRAQAEWTVAQRAERRARRAKAVAKAATASRRDARAGARKPARKAVAKAAATGPAGAKPGPSGRGVLVAEGDSWFDYPFHDVLRELDDEFGWDVEQVAHRGDSVESMAYDGGQLDDFVRVVERVARRGDTPRAILVSGGGNDVAGDAFAMLVNHRSSPVFGLNPAILQGLLETRIRVAYATVLQAVTVACESLLGTRVPILLHGYDYPVPDGRGVLGGWGWLPGPWLEPGFREKGYDDLAERVDIARDLIDRFYAMLGALVATPAFAHVRVVDLRNALSTELAGARYKAWWGNELHPTQMGFRKVAGLFDAKL